MSARWQGELTRADLLGLAPREAMAGGLGADRGPDAPPLLTVAALAFAWQAVDEGAPREALGLGVAACGMVQDHVGPGPLTREARLELADRLAFQAEGHPRTAAWFMALALAVTTGAELASAQAFLVRTMDLMLAVEREATP